MSWRNVKLIFLREVRDQLRDRRTLFMITILPVLLYPMLGLGVVEMMLTFSEQKRTVVILNADQLPTNPAFLDESGIHEHWFSGGTDDSSRLRIVTDLMELPEETEEDESATPAGEASPRELLTSAVRIADQFQQLEDGKTEELPDQRIAAAQEQLSTTFAESPVQVLVLVPEGYGDAIRQLHENTIDGTDSVTEMPSLKVIRNSADDKSVVAFGRMRNALMNWERAVRADLFEQASLRTELQNPASLEWIELARGEEVAANVWSKIFPSMLVIMALTGAFYPAVDLGAGEKERGTMETLLISPARRIELVLGKFATVLIFSIGTALMNLLSMGFTGSHMASAMGAGAAGLDLELPGMDSILWILVLLVPLAALFSALCLALATFAKSTKEGQYYLNPLLMIVMGLTVFCMSPAIEITPLYSIIPVINVALLLKGLLLSTGASGDLLMYAVPVLISSFGYSLLALWWAIDLYNSEGVLFREAEKFDLRSWLANLTRTKDPVPAFPEAICCFVIILFLQFIAMNYLKPDLSGSAVEAGRQMMQTTVVQQLTMIACPAVFMGLMLTTSLRATFRLRMPSISSLLTGITLAVLAHPLSIELANFMVGHGFLPPPPTEGLSRINDILKSAELSPWLIITVFAVTPAICEEIAFRGFILSGLAKGGRLGIAVIISSMMFGIIHMIPQQALNAALLGLVLGLLAVHSRSLFPAIAFHFCNNAIATLHAKNGFGLKPDGVFFTEIGGQLRYELPTLLLCGIGMSVMVVRMVRDLQQQQEEKRRSQLESFDAPNQPSPAASRTETAQQSIAAGI